MIPLHLHISGFLSYREPVELDFTGLDLACISGQNGAGKSSLLDAVTWALFGVARKKDDSIINNACSAAEVAFTFAYEGNVYRIQRSRPRGKTGALDLFIHQDPQACLNDPQAAMFPGAWKPLTEHSIRESEQTIRRTLRLDYDTFINASFFLQGKADLFCIQNPGDRKRILSAILGLETWEEYRQQAADRRRHLEQEITALDGRLQEISAELAQEPERRAALKDLTARLEQHTSARQNQEQAVENLRRLHQALEKQRESVSKLKERWQETAARLKSLEATLASRSSERQVYQAQISRSAEITQAYQDWQSARSELQEMDQVAARFREQEKERQQPRLEIAAARARLEQEVASLDVESRSVSGWQSQLADLHSRAAGLQEKIHEIEAYVSTRAVVERDAANLKDLRDKARAEKPVLKQEMEKIHADMVRLDQETGALCPICSKPLTNSERLALVATMKATGSALAEQFRKYEADLKNYDSRLQEFENEKAKISLQEKELAANQRQYDQLDHQASTLQDRIAAWEAGGALRLQSAREALASENYAPEPRQRLAFVDAALQALGYDPALHDAVKRRELDGRASEESLRQLETARAALQPLEREIGGLEGECQALRARSAEEESTWQAAEADYQQAAASSPALEPAERQLVELKEQENALTMQVGAARQKVNVLDGLRERQTKLNTQRDDLTHRVGQFKTLERAFSKDGVPAMLIEQALPEIEDHANDILQRLSGGSMSVSFATQREYKDRNRDDRKETLDIRISDSSGTRDYEMFSGGEAFRVNFAIRLALSRVLSQRAGARLQMLVIDEGFGSQDAQGRQRLIEAINSVRQEFKSILVITHMEELKDHFPYRIEVEKGELGSSVKVV